MSSRPATCPQCGAPVTGEAAACAVCGSPLEPTAAPATEETHPSVEPGAAESTPAPEIPKKPAESRAPRGSDPNSSAAEFTRRLARLAQWAESARSLGIDLPRVPAWAQEAAARSTKPEAWEEVVRGVERLAQQRTVGAFETWEGRTRSRLQRLEAYSVDIRLEREQIEDAVHAAKMGDIPQAFVVYQQVDRVVSLKERHLNQARTDLERLVAFLSDISALGLDPPEGPAEVATELEAELRAGRIAPLRQQIRTLRQDALTRLKQDLPEYVTTYGERLVEERGRGASNAADATELARGAREVLQGHPEEGVRTSPGVETAPRAVSVVPCNRGPMGPSVRRSARRTGRPPRNRACGGRRIP